MPIGSAFNSGLEGFNRASQGIERASAEINRASIEALVNLKVEEFNAKANTQSIQTADDVLGTLIDINV